MKFAALRPYGPILLMYYYNFLFFKMDLFLVRFKKALKGLKLTLIKPAEPLMNNIY